MLLVKKVSLEPCIGCAILVTSEGPLQLGRPNLMTSQRADPCLATFFEAVMLKEEFLSVPSVYCEQILNLAHDNAVWSLGDYKNVQSDIVRLLITLLLAWVESFCGQVLSNLSLASKPNQVSPAPLQPIPVIGEPYERHCGLCRPSPQIKICLSISLDHHGYKHALS